MNKKRNPTREKLKNHVPRGRRSYMRSQIQLDHVDYFSDIDEASTNDDLSSVRFISKETCATIFCRRLIPLEIPIAKIGDEISAVSSTNDSFHRTLHNDTEQRSESKSRAESTLPKLTAAEGERDEFKLDNVDYISTFENASDNHDLSTLEHKIPHHKARVAFDKNKATRRRKRGGSSNGQVRSGTTSYESIPKIVIGYQYSNCNASVSTLGSSSMNDEKMEEDLSLDGENGKELNPRVGKDTAETVKGIAKTSTSSPMRTPDRTTYSCAQIEASMEEEETLEAAQPQYKEGDKSDRVLSGEGKSYSNAPRGTDGSSETEELSSADESPTDARIRELKQRIQRMQQISSLETGNNASAAGMQTPRQPDLTSQGNSMDRAYTKSKKHRSNKKRKDVGGVKSIERKIHGNHVDTAEMLSSANRGKSSAREKWKLNVAYLDEVEEASDNNDLSTVEIRISKKHASRAFASSHVPFEVPLDDHEEVSTIHCDLEMACQRSLSASELRGVTIPLGDESEIESKLFPQHRRCSPASQNNYRKRSRNPFETAAREIRFQLRKVHSSLDQRLGPVMADFQTKALAFWKKNMAGRSNAEKATIGVIVASVFILFIILVSVIAKP